MMCRFKEIPAIFFKRKQLVVAGSLLKNLQMNHDGGSKKQWMHNNSF
jgi:ribosome-associated protein YbcJ (S4-like RNA binding protein)